MKQPRYAVLSSKQAGALRADVSAAHETVKQAEDQYHNLLAIASATDLGPDGLLALHQQGRVYATAVLNYSNAVMALLSFAETGREADATS